MTQLTKWPATVNGLVSTALERGVNPADLLVELERDLGPCPRPPAGYTLTRGKSDLWIGDDVVNTGWILTPGWKFDTGHCINVWTVKDRDLTPTEALELGTALIQAAQAERAESK